MTLTAGQLAPLAASAKTLIDAVIAKSAPTPAEITAAQVEGFDPSGVTYATLVDLFEAKQSGYDMGISTYDGLDAHIQVYVDNSALLNANNLQRLRFITMPSRIRAVHEDNPLQFNISETITVPDDCYLLKVSYQAAGGWSGASQRDTGAYIKAGGGGGGGAGVFDFEIAVSPLDQMVLSIGDTMTLGALTVQAGGNGDNYSANPTYGGIGGKVLWNGQPVDDGITAIAGTAGADGNINAYVSGVVETTNGKKQGAGGGLYPSTTNSLGAGGGASPSNDGENATTQYVSNLPDQRPALLGTGASSFMGVYANNTDRDAAVAAQKGGSRSPYVIINFVKQPA